MPETPPPHWMQHNGTNSWFTLWHPPTWQVRPGEGGTINFLAPDDGGVLSLNAFWLEPGQAVSLDRIVDIERLFPRRRRVQELKSPTTGGAVLALGGESPRDEPGAFWQRWLRPVRWRHWRIWCLAQSPVYVLALYLQTGNHDPEAETVASMIVNTLVLNPTPPVPPEVFARQVLDLARRKFPLLDCESAPDFQLSLGESKVNLFNFYRSYVNAPEQFEDIVLPALTTVVQVQGWGKAQTEPDLADVRERIMPMLYPEDVWREQFPNFIGAPWVGGLVVLYVVDESQAYWYIRGDLLTHWGLSVDDVHDIAMQNLDRYFEEQPMEFTLAGEESGPRLLMPTRPDAYNAARLLSDAFHFKLRELFGGEFAVGTPSRDFFVAVSLDSTETVEHVRKKVGEDFRQMDHPLSERLLLVTLDGVTEFVPR